MEDARLRHEAQRLDKPKVCLGGRCYSWRIARTYDVWTHPADVRCKCVQTWLTPRVLTWRNTYGTLRYMPRVFQTGYLFPPTSSI